VADLSALHDLALQIAPELKAQPLYLLPNVSEVGCHGLGAMVPDATKKRELISAGLWCGPGPLIQLDVESIENGRHSFTLDTTGVLIHELGHILPAQRIEHDPEPTDELIAKEAKSQEYIDALELRCIRKGLEPWLVGGNHGLYFIRICLHLMHRAKALGVPHIVPVAGFQYGLSPGWEYRDALGDEPERCRSMTFTEIQEQPKPAAFAKLWNDDVNRWEEKQNEHRTTNRS
jgi:hypothetical protein